MDSAPLPTRFAPAERATADQLAEDFTRFAQLKDVNAFIDALPYIAAVLNRERQIVYANEALLKASGLTSLDLVIGDRLGEYLHCHHAHQESGGCGTSEDCRYCGAVQAIMQAHQLQTKVEKECRILSDVNGEPVAWDFFVTASPFHCGDSEYTILSLVDISNEKRREALERIFFHDIINTAGSLSGILGILKEEGDQRALMEYLPLAEDISRHLIDEILAQRQLLAAEKGELDLVPKPVLSHDIIREVVRSVMQHSVARGRTLLIAPDTYEMTLFTDPVLLSRVLLNMLKNALEATQPGTVVRVGCLYREGRPAFWVHNQQTMDAKTQSQVFLRSFSTKGQSRGLGTYSMKLLGEKYLRGRVSFTSQPEAGTTFWLDLPATLPVK